MFNNSIDNDQISFSVRNGLYLPFMHKGHQVIVHNASWSFREKIWIDDELVVDQNNYTVASTHQLDVGGDTLTISFGYRDKMREIFIEVTNGDETIHSFSHRPAKEVEPKKLVLVTIGFGLAGAALGYGLGRLLATLFGGS